MSNQCSKPTKTWTNFILIFSSIFIFCTIMFIMVYLTSTGIIHLLFVLIPAIILLSACLFSALYYFTPLGKYLYNKHPSIFNKPE